VRVNLSVVIFPAAESSPVSYARVSAFKSCDDDWLPWIIIIPSSLLAFSRSVSMIKVLYNTTAFLHIQFNSFMQYTHSFETVPSHCAADSPPVRYRVQPASIQPPPPAWGLIFISQYWMWKLQLQAHWRIVSDDWIRKNNNFKFLHHLIVNTLL